jgi:hypothetical protein
MDFGGDQCTSMVKRVNRSMHDAAFGHADENE